MFNHQSTKRNQSSTGTHKKKNMTVERLKLWPLNFLSHLSTRAPSNTHTHCSEMALMTSHTPPPPPTHQHCSEMALMIPMTHSSCSRGVGGWAPTRRRRSSHDGRNNLVMSGRGWPSGLVGEVGVALKLLKLPPEEVRYKISTHKWSKTYEQADYSYALYHVCYIQCMKDHMTYLKQP